MSASIEEFDFSVDVLSALLWRNNDAASLQSLLQSKQDWYAQNFEQFWDEWYVNVFNIDTANEFGLSVWALILGIPLTLIVEPNAGPQFGFGPASNGRQNFNRGNFGASQSGVGLTLEQKRLLLKLRYYKLVSRCTVPEINARMKVLFSQYGSVYVLDGNNMEFITYVFGFSPDAALRFVLENFDVLPRPAAVGIKTIVATRPVFGFGEFNQNFNNGTFWA